MKWFELYIAIGWIVRLAMVPVILRRQLAPGARYRRKITGTIARRMIQPTAMYSSNHFITFAHHPRT